MNAHLGLASVVAMVRGPRIAPDAQAPEPAAEGAAGVAS